MKILMRQMGGLGLSLAATLAVSTVLTPAVRAEEVAKTYTVSGHAKVRVQTDDGAVRVSTGDIKQVEIRVTYKGYTLDKDLRITTSQNGDSIEVVAKTVNSWSWKWNVKHSELRVEVHMPKDADLDVTSGDGSVEAASITGSLDIRSGDGSITVQGAKATFT